jgi:pre-rRNA-processing protein IPI3
LAEPFSLGPDCDWTYRQPITSLAISFTYTLLLVGTAFGAINIYDTESHQLLRTITTHKDKGLSVIYLQCMLKPTDLQGHATMGDGGVSAKEPIPLRPVVPFQRMRDPKAREVHEVIMMIPQRLKVRPHSLDLHGSSRCSIGDRD